MCVAERSGHVHGEIGVDEWVWTVGALSGDDVDSGIICAWMVLGRIKTRVESGTSKWG